MSKQISTVLNLVNHWTTPMAACVQSTLKFTTATREATEITKALDKDGTKAVRSYANQIQHLHNQVKTVGSGISGTFKNMARSALSFGIGLASGLSLKTIAANAQAAQKATAQMATVLKSTGGAAGLTQKQLLDLAAAQSRVTTYSKGTNIATENLLLTFTNIKGGVFSQALSTVNNMSTALGQDTKNSAIQLGKALNDPIKGITALSRVGVNFTAQQKNTIKNLTNTGQAAKAQQIILNELNKEFGGSATSAAKTWNGQVAIMKNTLSGLGGSIATLVMPYATQFVQWMGQEVPKGVAIIQAYLPGIAKTISNIVKQSSPIIGGIVKDVGSIVIQLLPKFRSSTQNLGKSITTIVTGPLYGLRNILDFLKDHIGFTRTAIILFVAALGTIKTLKTVTELGQFIKSFKDAKKAIDEARAATGNLSIVQKIGGGFKTLGSNLLSVGRNALTAASNIRTFIARTTMTGISKGTGAIRTLSSNLLGAGRNALTTAKNVAVMGAGVAKQGAIFVINAARIAIFKGATLAVATAQKIAAGAQRLLNLAMNANPIIKVISVIIALGSALVVLYQKNVWFRNKVNAVFAFFKTLPAKFRGWAHDMINGFVKGIEEKFAPIKKASKAIADIVKKFLHFSKPDEGPLTTYGQWMPDMITGLSTGMTNSSPIIWNATSSMTAGMSGRVGAYVSSCRPAGVNSTTRLSGGVKAGTPGVLKSTASMTNGMSTKIKAFSNSCNPLGVVAINQLKAGIANSGAQSSIMATVKKLTDKVITAFKDGFGIRSPSKVFFKLGNYIVQGFINGLNNKDMGKFIKKWIGSMTSAAGSASGDVVGWLTAALGVTGTPMSWLPGLEQLVSRESGGNPLAVNPQGVGNQHATGLLQTLGSTFESYRLPILPDSMFNPIADAAAAINYIKKTYGTIYNTPLFKGGAYVGYANGGIATKPSIFGENGSEIAIPLKPTNRSKQLLNEADDIINNGSGKGMILNVAVNVKGNMIGNEDFANSIGQFIYKKIADARRKL